MKDFDVIFIVLIIAYGIYLMYKFIKDYIAHIKLKKEFLETHKKIEAYKGYNKLILIYLLIIIGMIVLPFILKVNFVKHFDLMSKVAYLFILLFIVSLILDTLITRQAYFSEDGFFFEKTFYRYKSVKEIIPSKMPIFSPYSIQFLDGTKMKISKEMGEILKDKIKIKKHKKGDKHGKK